MSDTAHQARPRTAAERRAAAQAFLAVAKETAQQIGVDEMLDALMVVWINLAVAVAGEEWAKSTLTYARDVWVGEIALGDMAGRA